MMRLLHSLPELLIVIKGIFVAMRAVLCTCFLLVFMCYVFAIVMRQLTDGSEFGDLYYPNVLTSLRYLLTLGVCPDLADAVVAVSEAGTLLALVFVAYIMLISIT